MSNFKLDSGLKDSALALCSTAVVVFLITFTTNWAGQVAVVPKSNEIEMTQEEKGTSMNALAANGHLTTHNFVRDIVNHPAFRQFGDLMLPSNDNTGYYDTPLGDIGSLIPYHSHVNPGIVVAALNHLIDEVMPSNFGKTIVKINRI